MYCKANPIGYYDPSGKNIVHTPIDTSDFQMSFPGTHDDSSTNNSHTGALVAVLGTLAGEDPTHLTLIAAIVFGFFRSTRRC